jgi:hypothetical protein
MRPECAGHVGLIGKPANRCYLLDRQTALCQQASSPIDAPLDNVSVRGSAKGFTEVAGKRPHTHSRHCRQRFKIELFVQPEVAVLSHRRVDPRRLLGFFKSLLLSCHLAVKADHMALHHAPMTKHYFAALAAGHRYGLSFSVEYQSGFCFRADSLHTVIFSVPNCQGSNQANPHRRTVPRRDGQVPF